MNKKILFAALATVAMASCTSDEFTGVVDNNPNTSGSTEAISLGGAASNITRAPYTGAEAAAKLNNEFTVLGTLLHNGATEMVFNNYKVKYDGLIGNDESNEYGWSYLTTEGQNIKYWNLGASQYDFVAFSGIPAGKSIASTTENTIEGVTADDVESLYMSDRVTASYDGSTGVQYGNKVGFTFKRLGAKVRLGIYETVPGYAVSNVRFYYGDNALSADQRTGKSVAGLRGSFTTTANYSVTYDAQKTAVANLDVDNSKYAKEFVLGELNYKTAKATDGKLLKTDGTSDLTGDKAFLGTNSTEACYAEISGDAWHNILPYTNNDENLVLRVDYDLVPLDGGDVAQSVIHVYNASAVVPKTWAQWKSNYAYTYLFKISDQTSGQTTPPTDVDRDTDGDGIPDVDDDDDDNDGIPDVDDPDDDGDGIPDDQDPDNTPETVPDPDTENPNPNKPAVSPIVFDATVSVIEDYNQETITGVTALGGNAITTYSVTSHVTDAAEYAVGEVIKVSSPSHGQWKIGYSSYEVTEKDVEANPAMTTYTTIAGETTGSQTIDKASVYEAEFTAERSGYVIVWLRYLPTGLEDVDGNYVNIFKVVKIHD